MKNKQTWAKAWAMLSQRERRVAFLVLGVVLFSVLGAVAMVASVMPFLTVLSDPLSVQSDPWLAWAYDRLSFETTKGFLSFLGLCSLLVIVLASALQIARVYVVARFSTMRAHTFSERLLAAYLGQPYYFFMTQHSDKLSTRILVETEQVVKQFLMPAIDFIASSLTLLALIGFLVWLDPAIALNAIAVLGIFYGLVFIGVRNRLQQLGKIRQDANRARYRSVTEAISGAKELKLLGRERDYHRRYLEPSQRMARAVVSVQVIANTPAVALQAFAFGGFIVLSLALVGPTALSTGEALADIIPLLGTVAFAGQRMMPELSKVYNSAALIQANVVAVDAVHEDLAAFGGNGALPAQAQYGLPFRHELRLEDVSFAYDETSRAGLSNLCLSITKGEKIGIIGSTGAGKTTFADIILGLLRPRSGSIVVDGTKITETNLRSWQRSVGYVPQEIYLIDSSIAENIAFGLALEDIDMDRVLDAARMAQLEQLILEEFPDGFSTKVGERGVALSGGQRQRIGIARALYNEAELIVFDEATSALDTLTEQEVMGSIEALPGEKTVLIIAHRLSTVKSCDRILVLEKGRIVAIGAWDELIEQNAAFREMVSVGSQ
jgi:ABC-type multidrug transport system fused ATPase/permease subunit